MFKGGVSLYCNSVVAVPAATPKRHYYLLLTLSAHGQKEREKLASINVKFASKQGKDAAAPHNNNLHLALFLLDCVNGYFRRITRQSEFGDPFYREVLKLYPALPIFHRLSFALLFGSKVPT